MTTIFAYLKKPRYFIWSLIIVLGQIKQSAIMAELITWSATFFKLLQAKTQDLFWHQLYYLLPILIKFYFLMFIVNYLTQLMTYALWNKIQPLYLNKYTDEKEPFHQRHHQNLPSLNGAPIEAGIKGYVFGSLEIIFSITSASFMLYSLCQTLIAQTANIHLSIFHLKIPCAIYCFSCIIVYCAINTLCTTTIAQPIKNASKEVNSSAAKFREMLCPTEQEAGMIHGLNGRNAFQILLHKQFTDLKRKNWKLMLLEIQTNLSTSLFTTLAQVMPYALLAPIYFTSGQISFALLPALAISLSSSR